MTGWKQNACSLCYINCGIGVLTDGRVITRVRGDKAHPHTAGYICHKDVPVRLEAAAPDEAAADDARRRVHELIGAGTPS